MLLSSESTKTVAEAGGWSSEKMVANVYGHLTHQFIVDAMEKSATVSSTATNTPGLAPQARKSLK